MYNPYFFAEKFPLQSGYICAAHLNHLSTLSAARKRAIIAFATTFRHPSIEAEYASAFMPDMRRRKTMMDALGVVQSFAYKLYNCPGRLCVDDYGKLTGRVDRKATFDGTRCGVPSNGVVLSLLVEIPENAPPYARDWLVLYNLLVDPSGYARGRTSTVISACSIVSGLLQDDGTTFSVDAETYNLKTVAEEAATQNIVMKHGNYRIVSLPPSLSSIVAGLGDDLTFEQALDTVPDIANVVAEITTIANGAAKLDPAYHRAGVIKGMGNRKVPFGKRLKDVVALLGDTGTNKAEVYKTMAALDRSMRAKASQRGVKVVNSIKGKRT